MDVVIGGAKLGRLIIIPKNAGNIIYFGREVTLFTDKRFFNYV